MRIDFFFGEKKGRLLGLLPDNYLRWMANTPHDGQWVLLANLSKEVLGNRNWLGTRKDIIRQVCRWVVPTQEYVQGKHPLSGSVRSTERDFTGCTSMALKEGCGQKELKHFLDRLGRFRVQVNLDTYASVLRCCGNAQALWDGKCAHAHIIRAGYDQNGFVGNLLVQMYGKCGCPRDARGAFDRIRRRTVVSWNIMIWAYGENGCVEDARLVFGEMPRRNVISWTAIITAYAKNGYYKDAFEQFRQMQLTGVAPDKIAFISFLDACAGLAVLAEGTEIHADILDRGLETDVVVGNALVHMYGKCGSLDDARSVFDNMPQRSLVSWNGMMSAYSQNGHGEEALKLLTQIQMKGMEPNKITFIIVLDACAGQLALTEGKEIHASVTGRGFQTDTVVGNALLYMYGKCGSLDDATSVFNKMPQRNVVSWTSMIAAYSQNGDGEEALKLFREMQLEGVLPDKITFITVLEACAGMANLAEGKESHASIIDRRFETDVTVENALVNMYGKCGCLGDARCVFDKMSQHNVVSWNAMIGAYSQNGCGKDALELLQKMCLKGVNPNKVTFISMLDACACLATLADGKEGHAGIIDSGFESDIVVGSALVNMYGKCGAVDDARSVFDKMPDQNVFSWNAIIAAYSQNWQAKEALELFQQMQMKGVASDKITFINILGACAGLAALAEGTECHAHIIAIGYETDVAVGNCLINMYGKSGCLVEAKYVFEKMPQHNTVSWNTIITAYSQNGHAKESLRLFQQMQLKGVVPNKITFISILSGCSHAGLLDDGWHYFVSMSIYSIVPLVEHFLCMIDLLGRAGRLDEAEDLVVNMPFGPSVVAWMSLLGACRIHGDVGRGTHTAEHVFELDPQNDASFVLLSNIYVAAGKLDDAAKVRNVMKDRGVKKQPGRSCIEVKKRIHEFSVGDTHHPQKEEIFSVLQQLSKQMAVAGYMPDTKTVLCDAEEVNKQHILCYHSEKLAIAFGLISTLPGAPLLITKNLRVCSDCHAATKFVSKIGRRKIIVRDANRFHHFEHGMCSCGDYW